MSKDGGRSFSKTGAILLPYLTKAQCRDGHHNAYADGSLVEGNEKGFPVDDRIRDKNESSEVYWYTEYSDPMASTVLLH